jgi:transposase InsO family protein
VLQYLKDSKLPDKNGMDSAEYRKLCKRIKKRSLQFIIINGVLFRQISKTYPKPRRVPAITERSNIISTCHDEMGHYGVGKTLYMVAKNYYWPQMAADVRTYCEKCEQCKAEKSSFKLRTELHPLPIASLFERISVGLVGPLTKTRKGHQFLAVAICAYSRFVFAAPLPNRLSQTVADFFFSSVISRVSAPQICRTDNGSEFTGQPFKSLLAQYGIEHQLITPRHPESNGLVERVNSTIIHSIRRTMEGHANTWDDQLEKTIMGYNFSRQASTKFSPYFLVFGQEARMGDAQDADAMQRAALLTKSVEDRERHQEIVSATAVMNMKTAQDKQCKDFDKRRPMDFPLFDSGDMVLVKAQKKKSKLHSQAEGPYAVVAYNKEHTLVKLADANGREWTEHPSNITLWKTADDMQTPTTKKGTKSTESGKVGTPKKLS